MVVGGLCGLAWAASLRALMAEFAGPGHSTVTWLTPLLVLLPGVVVGAAFGRAAFLRGHGRPAGRSTVFAPVLFLSVLLTPGALITLVTTGMGGGAVFVPLVMLAGGHAFGRKRWTPVRVLTLALTILGIAALFAGGGFAAGLPSPRGFWVGTLGASLLAVAALASALPYPAAPEPAHTETCRHWEQLRR